MSSAGNAMAATTRCGVGGPMEESQITNQATASTSLEEMVLEMFSLGHVMEVRINIGGHTKRDRTVPMMMATTTCSTMQPTGTMGALFTSPMATRMLQPGIAIQSGMINTGDGPNQQNQNQNQNTHKN